MPSTLSNCFVCYREFYRYLREMKGMPAPEQRLARSRRIYNMFNHFGLELEAPAPERLYRDAPCIYVGNHNSLLDPLILCAIFTEDVRFLAKSMLFKLPTFGQIMKNEAHIPVFRGRNAQALNEEQRERIMTLIQAGMSLFFFPEGRRSTTGELAPFKLGAFRYAVQNKRPIVPMILAGTRKALPKGSIHLRPGLVQVEMLEALWPEDGAGLDERVCAEALASKTHALMRAAIEERKAAGLSF